MTALVVLAAVVTGTLGVARATRLTTSDAYPPARAVRLWWINATEVRGHGTWREGWAPLATCPFCFAPYAAAVNLTWALWSGAPFDGTALADWHGWASVWWAVNVWAAVSYLAAMVVVRDEPPAE